jgi:hypothetical protein
MMYAITLMLVKMWGLQFITMFEIFHLFKTLNLHFTWPNTKLLTLKPNKKNYYLDIQ